MDLIEPFLAERVAFKELFSYGGDLTTMLANTEITTGGKIDKALTNAQRFTEAVYERIRAA